MGDQDGWISVREAVNRLSLSFGGDFQAKRILADRLRDGALTAKAARLTETQDMGTVNWKARKPEIKARGNIKVNLARYRPDKIDTPVDSAIWSLSDSWESDQALWQWGEGNFVVTLKRQGNRPWHRYVMTGVKFRASEIDRMIGSDAPTAAPVLQSTPQLNPPVKWRWEDVLIDLMMIADADSLEMGIGPLQERGGTARLQKWFADKFMELQGDHPSKTELYLRARKIVRRLRSPHTTVFKR